MTSHIKSYIQRDCTCKMQGIVHARWYQAFQDMKTQTLSGEC